MSDLENVVAALNLEYGAHRRYEFQIERSPFMRLNMILEGVRRTEGEHIEAMVAYIKEQLATDPEVGRGFATVLAHLKLDLEFEQMAVTTYGRFGREAQDPTLKKTFQRLAHAEGGHINLFRQLIAQIEANEFPALIYCPVCGWELDFGVNPPEGMTIRCERCKRKMQLGLRGGDFMVEMVETPGPV